MHRHLNPFRSLFVATTSVIFCAPAFAEIEGNPFRGAAYSKALCGGCHAIDKDDLSSPDAMAAPFTSMNLNHADATDFTKWLNTEHPLIPNTIVKEDRGADIAAYIQSVQSQVPD